MAAHARRAAAHAEDESDFSSTSGFAEPVPTSPTSTFPLNLDISDRKPVNSPTFSVSHSSDTSFIGYYYQPDPPPSIWMTSENFLSSGRRLVNGAVLPHVQKLQDYKKKCWDGFYGCERCDELPADHQLTFRPLYPDGNTNIRVWDMNADDLSVSTE